MGDQLLEHVKRMQAEGVPEADIIAFVQKFDSPEEPTPQAQPEQPTTMSGLMDAALRSKGIERTPAEREMSDNMAAGVMGGGLLSAAPAAVTQGPKLIQGLARRLYGGLLKTSKSIKQEFGDVVPGLLENRRLITRGGAQAAEDAVAASRRVADAMIENSPRPSQGVSWQRVVREFKPVTESVQARIDAGVSPQSELDKVAQRVKALRGSAMKTGGRFDPTRAQTLKRTAQDAAEGAYTQMQRGNAKMLSADDLLDAATARGFKGGIEDIVPGIAQQNANTQKLIGQSRALGDAVGRTTNHLPFGSVSDLAAMMASHANPVAGVVGKAATMAGPGSAMAIGLNELSRLGVDDAMQRALMLVMSQGSHQQ